MSVNKVILVGNVGGNPEIRSTQDGKRFATFSLATNESWRDKNSGELQKNTEWHRIAIFADKLVDVVERFVKKGSKLYIEGSIRKRKFTDSAGVEKEAAEILLQNYNSKLTLLDSRDGDSSADFNSDNSSSESQGSSNSKSSSAGKSSANSDYMNDDVPF